MGLCMLFLAFHSSTLVLRQEACHTTLGASTSCTLLLKQEACDTALSRLLVSTGNIQKAQASATDLA